MHNNIAATVLRNQTCFNHDDLSEINLVHYQLFLHLCFLKSLQKRQVELRLYTYLSSQDSINVDHSFREDNRVMYLLTRELQALMNARCVY